jgi:serine/threonine-protein kinase
MVYTAEEYDGQLYIAMEYVEGEDLSQLLEREGRLHPARTSRLVRVVAETLDAVHRTPLVHRDIKPSNLLVIAAGSEAESVKLVDFGLSRSPDLDGGSPRVEDVMGAVAYSAPEQLTRGAIGASDQYALACVAFECLTGHVPYPMESRLAVMAAHQIAAPPPAAALHPELPTAVDAVLARGMAKDPAARYPTCAAFADALAAALDAHATRRPRP